MTEYYTKAEVEFAERLKKSTGTTQVPKRELLAPQGISVAASRKSAARLIDASRRN